MQFYFIVKLLNLIFAFLIIINIWFSIYLNLILNYIIFFEFKVIILLLLPF